MPELRSSQLPRIPASSVAAPGPAHRASSPSQLQLPVPGKLFPPPPIRCVAFILCPAPSESSRAYIFGREHLTSIPTKTNMASNTTILEHPSAGQIHGVQPKEQPHVEQYLGIQYATLENRFARGKLVEAYTAPIQATKTGQVIVDHPWPFPLIWADKRSAALFLLLTQRTVTMSTCCCSIASHTPSTASATLNA